jgi:hypothetical protein
MFTVGRRLKDFGGFLRQLTIDDHSTPVDVRRIL